MINKCVVCGKEFESPQSNYTICSPECREIRKKQWYQKRRSDPDCVERDRRQSREFYHKIRKFRNIKPNKRCVQCGGDTQSHSAHYCIECLLNNYFENPNCKNFSRLSNRGFDKQELIEEAESRGIKIIPNKRGRKKCV